MKRGLPHSRLTVRRGLVVAVALSLFIPAAALPLPHLHLPQPRHHTRRRKRKVERVQKGPEANAKYRAKAAQLLGEKKYTQAFHQFDEALLALPDDVQTLEDYGRALYHAHRYQDAAAKFQRITQVAQNQPVAFYNLGYALVKTRDFAGAEAAYRQYLSMQPNDPDAIYGLAECLKAEGKDQDAAAEYRLYVKTENRPGHAKWVAEAKAKAASLAAASGALASAAAPAETAPANPAISAPAPAATTPPPSPAASAPAVAVTAPAPAATAPVSAPAPATAPSPTTAASTPAVTVTAPAPATTAPAPASNGGGLLAGAGSTTSGSAPASTEGAASGPDAYAQRDPEAAIAKIREGDGYFTQKRYREALFAYQDAANLDDQSAAAVVRVGLAYAKLNYFDKAIAEWKQALVLDPNDRYAPGYIAEAQKHLQENPATAPSDQPQPVGVGSGVALATDGSSPQPSPSPAANQVSDADRQAARDAYSRAVKDMYQAQFANAISELSLSIQKDPTFVSAWVARGGAYFGAGSYRRAESDYKKSLELSPDLATPLYGLGRAYDKLGERAKACEYYRRYGRSTGSDARPALQKQSLDLAASLCG